MSTWRARSVLLHAVVRAHREDSGAAPRAPSSPAHPPAPPPPTPSRAATTHALPRRFVQVVIDRGTSTFLGMLDIYCDDTYITTAQADGTLLLALIASWRSGLFG